MRERRRFGAPVVGGSSLLIIFAVLCLTVLAMLSLATVRADERLSQAAAENVGGYYAADTAAEEILARLRRGETPAGVTVGADGVCAYACPISGTQELSVRVRLDGAGYEILRWEAASTAQWTPDDTLTLWDGEVPDGAE